MAEVHARSIRSARGFVAALASSTPERTREAAARHGASRAASVDEILDDPHIDVVHICTPNASHADYAERALEAGKHVICEKPIGRTVEEAQRMADLAKRSGLVAAVPFINRFYPLAREARDRLRADAGPVTSVMGSYLQDWMLSPATDNWRVDSAIGGESRAFGDIGSHLVDLIEFITGEQITSLRAHTSVVNPERSGRRVETEDLAAAVVTFQGGGLGTLMVSQTAPGRKNALTVEVAKSNESLRFEQESPDSIWIGRSQGSEVLPRDAERLGEDARRLSILPAGHALGYQNAFDAFVADAYATIAGENRPGLPTFEDGLRAARITKAVIESARTGRDVQLP